MKLIQQVVAWFTDPSHLSGPDGIPTHLMEHIDISAASLLTGAVIALPIGIALGHYGLGGGVAINVSNLGRAVPSYAILVIAFQIFGGSVIPAYAALVALAIPPILTNAYVGMRGVDPDLKEAARGLGMRDRAILWRVELPVALPVMMAGVRTAGVQVVATATLAALIAFGGLGGYITVGIANGDDVTVLAGSLMVGALAGMTELGLGALQYGLTPRGLRRRPRDAHRKLATASPLGPAI